MHELYEGCYTIRDTEMGDISIESRKYQEDQGQPGTNDKGPYFCIRTGNAFNAKDDGMVHIHRRGDTLPSEEDIIDAVKSAWVLTGVVPEHKPDSKDVEQMLGEGWEGW